MPDVAFLAYEQCMLSGISSLMDAFGIANEWLKHFARREGVPASEDVLFRTEIVSPGGRPITAQGGIPLSPHRAMEEVKSTDLVLIPPHMFGVRHDREQIGDMLDWLVMHHQANARIGALCTGTFILAMTGLLDGRIATTNWQLVNRFRRQFPKVRLKPERVLTEDGGLICSGAVTASYNLGLYVMELFGSPELMRACSKALLVDPSRTTQAPYMTASFKKNHGDKAILAAQEWMEEHFMEGVTMEDAADYVGLSSRHFKRRFKQAVEETPLNYLQQVRLEAAKKALETTTDNIDEITRQVGYEDASTFRRLFKKHTTLSPREYRDKFAI
ncbi:transcriptional regulator, AraC family [Desulfatibacillum aliphaticivorans]|uniref:Transcriptional regulator, AraC family n=1 Tax=Desulfatibacillum aliphaticivorans TaxID=218208 RepID=B8FML1_DESAL|nr:helix-turn-helix domain-containing protein [Desulfatibacillum aliphaticivorans]ACL01878.1 transcriptional regulator, AraC family [Desulfatibacillum aliphaticivorans]